MNFDNDVFISYAHTDNEPLLSDPGWINTFHAYLKKRLPQLLGKSSRIWRDPKLAGNDDFDQVIQDKIATAQLLISVLSPSYITSEWCPKELKLFCNACEQQTGGVKVGSRSRIFKVVKTPVDRRRLPDCFQPLLGYEFYEEKDEGGPPLEYNRLFWQDWERRFATRMEKLARDISDTLTDESLWTVAESQSPKPAVPDHLQAESQPSSASRIRTVYVAESTADLNEARAAILAQLQQWGHRVLPDRSFPLTSPEYEEAVAEALSTADLSIHLVGTRYGVIPEGQEMGEKSIVVLQYELARRRADESSSFRYLLWTPSRSESKEIKPEQKLFIDLLQTDPQLLQTTLEELKTILSKELTKETADAPQASPAATSNRHLVYVIGTPEDFTVKDGLALIIPHLEQQGYDVITPQFDAQAVQDRLQNEGCLRRCDAVLIYYGSASEAWLMAKLAELRKAPGYGRKADFLATAVLVGPPLNADKQSWQTDEALVLRCGKGFDTTVVQPFLDSIAVVSSDGHTS
ncbi:TIR domain-containing protein [Synechococcus sp. Tobar12-5m-g]|uniref:TIR domain-containing protein n=1 Tax=unclassified Synechococcus TaxID=2626047 RepID=UPI0020CD1EC0|nr:MULTISPECIES: TIR domain-containing protein [unclassified Synechococcus]MCP9772440.1 TIR domain-containing protein [Synechococcus sp. Tobar12-5m-g]MCP9874268.1 TIR domain-containing protein [Synechococcus sp. Cruz CV-v-12]